MNVTTNNHRREVLTFAELTVSEREEFDYVTDDERYSPRFVRAYGNVYDVHDAERITVSPEFTSFGHNVEADSPLASWHGITTETMWSGTVFRLLSGDDDGFVNVGRVYSS